MLLLLVPAATAPSLVWNATPSVPTGLYVVDPKTPASRGDLVAARLPQAVRPLAASRGYLPATVPILKRVAAGPGDVVCARGTEVSVNGRTRAVRLPADPQGRRLPSWSGCRRVGPGEAFLLGDHRLSFDGRYFGISRPGERIGRVHALWGK